MVTANSILPGLVSVVVRPIRVADLTTPIPGGTGTFTGFTSVSANARHVAFAGLGSSGQAGVDMASALTEIAAAGDVLNGRTLTALRLGRGGLGGDALTFAATFTGGSEAAYAARGPAFTPTGAYVLRLPLMLSP